MEIRVGWATEFGRDKFDVSLDEGDLRRMMGEVGLGDSASVAEVSVITAYKLLSLEARRLAEVESLRLVTDETAKAGKIALVQKLNSERAELLGTLAKAHAA